MQISPFIFSRLVKEKKSPGDKKKTSYRNKARNGIWVSLFLLTRYVPVDLYSRRQRLDVIHSSGLESILDTSLSLGEQGSKRVEACTRPYRCKCAIQSGVSEHENALAIVINPGYCLYLPYTTSYAYTHSLGTDLPTNRAIQTPHTKISLSYSCSY